MFYADALAVPEKEGRRAAAAGDMELSAGLPVGFLRCTGDKYPRVLYASEGMPRLLGMTEEDEEWREMICSNLLFMIPFEDRGIFRSCLDAAGEKPVSLEHRVIRKDGGQRLLNGWLQAVKGETGEEYHFVYMPAPPGRTGQRDMREAAYRQALENVYDMVCLVDRTRNILECVHQNKKLPMQDLRFVQVVLDSVPRMENFQRICEEDRQRVEDFLTDVIRKGEIAPGEGRVVFWVTRGRQRIAYEMLAVDLDSRAALLCLRQQVEVIVQQSGTVMERTGSPRVSIRTFGYFDVFVDGHPMVFRNEKSKELLAVLVDRQGSFVSNPYIINCLWEDEPYGEKIQNRCRQVVHRLMQTLREYGVENIIERVDSKRRIVPELVQCDFFDYRLGDPQAERKFNGAYLSDYSWGEVTLSNLLKEAGTETV